MTMCQILDRVEAKGRKDGDERAAKAEKELSLVFQNMRNNGLSDSQIANLTGVSIEKVQKTFRKRLYDFSKLNINKESNRENFLRLTLIAPVS